MKNKKTGTNNKRLKEISLKQHQKIMLDMMKEFDSFCYKNNLNYYLTGGTLLGAIRHQGFIPWDDDVDIVMPRNDYEKLIKEDYISKYLKIISYNNVDTRYYHPFAHANVMNERTVLYEENIEQQTNKGIFIDIFPLDGVPDNKIIRFFHLTKLMFLENISSILIEKINVKCSLKNILKKRIKKMFGFVNITIINSKINDIAKKYKFEDCKNVAHTIALFNNSKRFITPFSEYKNYYMMKFEMYYFRVPCGYDKILTRSYGNYMELPKKKEQISSHGIKVYKK